MNKRRLTYVFNLILLAIFTFTTILYLYALFGEPREGEPYTGDFRTMPMNDSWLLEDEEGIHDIDLPYQIHENADKTVILKNILPSDIKDGMTICFRSCMQEITVRIDGKERASYICDNYKNIERKLPSAFIMIDLTDEDASKTIEAEITSTKTGPGKYASVYYGCGLNVWLMIIKKNMPIVLISLIVMIAGTGTLIAGIISRKHPETSQPLLYLAGTMLTAGMWVFSESELRQLAFSSPSYSNIFSYLLAGMIPAFTAQYFDIVQKRRYTKIYTVMTTVITIEIIINIILELFDIADLYDTMIFTTSLIGITILVSLATIMRDNIMKQNDYPYASYGMILFAMCGTAEVICFTIFGSYKIGAWIGLGLMYMLIATIIQTFVDSVTSVEQRRISLEKRTQATICTIAKTMDAKDKYTGGHSERVGEYARILCVALADKYGFTEDDFNNIQYIGNLHDIGKIAIPDCILNKEIDLTEEEFEIMKSHTTAGYDILSGLDDVEQLKECVRSHHEHYDGSGYPDGLKGDEIPVFARILGIVDCYDAMTTDRVYRKRLSDEVVCEEIKRYSGTQFDPEIASVMLKLMKDGTMSVISRGADIVE